MVFFSMSRRTVLRYLDMCCCSAREDSGSSSDPDIVCSLSFCDFPQSLQKILIYKLKVANDFPLPNTSLSVNLPFYTTQPKLWKVELASSLIKHHVWGRADIASHILNLGTRCKRVVSFTLQPLYRRWTIGALGFDSRWGLGIFLFTIASRTALGPTHPPIQWVPGALSLGVKRPGREAIRPLPHYTFMAWCLAKARGQLYLYPFTFTFTHWVIGWMGPTAGLDASLCPSPFCESKSCLVRSQSQYSLIVQKLYSW
jgi:hypothetical protein